VNGGSDAGVSFLETWEIVKRCGNPTVADYGGLSFGGPARWMSGYDKYLNSMHNRITDVAVIYMNTIEGLNMLRHWIYNHMDQATYGGVANFYSQFTSVTNQLPAGTPEAGRYVLTSWGASPNHAMTILGYNDSIRWDYNGDGQYTNTIDINGDGIINLSDWEIGGFKIANTYGTVTNWGDQGFSYAMYKSFADPTNAGGIWNNAVYISYAKQDLSPKLTMKITLNHTSRNKLKVVAGVANNLSATEPEVTLNLPIMDFQGGDKYMQGGTTEADKTIEFGLDVTPLLSEINTGQNVKFFLLIQENDPSNLASGRLISWELIDYNFGTVVIPTGYSNIPLVENGVTTFSVNAIILFNKPNISNFVLDDAKIYEPYSQQINVCCSSPPLKYAMAFDYSETAGSAAMPPVSAQQLSVNGSYSGYATKQLPFTFPFYGKTYTTVYPHVDGYLLFENHPTPWPDIIYEKTFFKNTRLISPYMGKPLVADGGDNDGIWYEGNQDSVTFRWKLSVYGAISSTEVNFAVRLYPDGRIKYFYGPVNSGGMKWISGISNGDGFNYHFTSITDSLSQPATNSFFEFATQPYPFEMSISETGLFYGTPQQSYTNVPIKFYVEDNNFIHTTKTLFFNTKGVEISYQITAGNDSIIEFGEDVYLTPTLKNVSSTTLHNVQMHLSINNPEITMVDSLEYVGQLSPGQILTLPGAFHFTVSNSIPNGQILDLVSRLVAVEDTFNRTISLPAWATDLNVYTVAVSDGNNNILMPGETGNLVVTIRNEGGATATNLNAVLSTIDPYITILQAQSVIDTVYAGGQGVFNFQVQALATCPLTHIAFTTFQLSGDKDVTLQDSIYFNIGPLIEDFETGNFSRFPWQTTGNANWIVSNSQPYEGLYSAQSGTISDNQETNLVITMEVLTGADISFYRKVSSEVNYDYLYFYIDGAEKNRWSGNVSWDKVTYPVTAGVHTFKWSYKKDYSVSTGADKAWIDFISWPPLANFLLIAYAGADDIACSGQGYTCQGQVMNAASQYWTTNGDGSFIINNTPNAIYLPGNNDLNNGIVTLTIHATQGSLPPVSDEVELTIIQGPVSNAGPDLMVCPGSTIQITAASVAGQTSMLWTTSGDGSFDDPTILDPVYTPGTNDLNSGSVNLTLTVNGSAECGPVNDVMTLTISPAVIANAGDDIVTPYNTSTQLNGSASGGTGTFSASWEPAALLIDPTSFTPTTINLTTSQVFTLTATNDYTGCFSLDEVIVTVSGGALVVQASALPQALCIGGSSQLSSLGSGGSGIYSYFWTSVPPGFTSNLQNPVVSPTETTTYTVEINDGSSSSFASTTVEVHIIPSDPLIPQGPSGVNVLANPVTSYTSFSVLYCSYDWHFSPPEAGTIVPTGTSCTVQWNPLFDGTAMLWVFASNLCGNSGSSDTLMITANSTIGVPDIHTTQYFNVFPNPGKGIFQLKFPISGRYDIIIYDQIGNSVRDFTIDLPPGTLTRKIDLNDVADGIYYVVCSSCDHHRSVKLVILK
jgi:hypothetical protein